MKEFEKWADKEDEDPRSYGSEEYARKCGWRAALEMANKLFLDGMHPQDVMFFIQKELEQ